MKKFLATLLAVCMIVSSVVVFSTTTVAAEDAGNTIYVSAEGNDENAGTESAPVATLNKAIALAKSGDTINVVGTIKFHTGETESGHSVVGSSNNKILTITGGTIDFTNIKHLSLKEDITFDNITLTFTAAKFLFAWGNDVTINENVTVNGKINVYAGGYGSSTGGTNITLLAGNYASIYGASHEAKYIIDGDTNVTLGGNVTADAVYGGSSVVNGDTHVTVGGSADIKAICGAGGTVNGDTYVVVKDNANPNSNPSNSSHNGGGYYIYGNGNGKVTGSTHVYFMDNAKAGYVVGGTSDTSGSVGGTANVYIMGGTTYSVYGCGVSVAADASMSANIIMTGGTAWQVFGGAESTGTKEDTTSSINGAITIKLLGGTVKRRVFGGSYNEVSLWGSWSNSHYVNGKITLILGENIDLALNNDVDHGCSAHSRRNGVASGESGTIIYTSATAKSNKSGKISVGYANGKTHEAAHVYSYVLNGNIITQTCSEHGDHSATATITPTSNTYNGSAIVVDVEYSENWEYEEFNISYVNNVNAGTATATLDIEGLTTINCDYNIAKLTQKEPSVYVKGDRVIGLTSAMEYSTDGKNYTRTSGSDTMIFANNKYYIRYAETENMSASRPTMVYFYNAITCFSANRVNTVQGKTVDVIVHLPSNKVGLDSFNISVGYDHTALTLEGITAVDFAGVELNEDVITWSGEETTKTGVVAKLTFRVSADANLGNYEISLTANGFITVHGAINVAEFVNGDANGDGGMINVSDVIALRGAVVNESTDNLASGADVNGDGIVNCQDIIIIRKYLANYNYTTGESSVVLGAAQ